MNLSECLYRLLLYLYPRRHRQEYGELMLLHVRDQLRDAREQGRWSVLRLWAGILLDTARTAPVEHLALAKESLMAIQAHTNRPLPWWQIILVILPGLAIIVTLATPIGGVPILAALLTVAVAAGGMWWRTQSFPAWALLLVGFVATLATFAAAHGVAAWFGRLWPDLQRQWRVYPPQLLGVVAAIVAGPNVVLLVRNAHRRGILARVLPPLAALLTIPLLSLLVGALQGPFRSSLIVRTVLQAQIGPILMLTFILLGLPLARRHGLLTTLFIVGSLVLVYGGFVDPAEGIASRSIHPLLGWLARLAAPALILVVASLWFLRARSRRWRRLGLLIPVAAAFAIALIISGVARAYIPISGFTLSEMLSLRLVQGAFAPLGLLLTVVIALILYDLPSPAADKVPLTAED